TCCLKGRGHAGELLRLVLPRRFGEDVLFTPASRFMIVILQGLLRLLECGLGFLGGRGRERGLLAQFREVGWVFLFRFRCVLEVRRGRLALSGESGVLFSEYLEGLSSHRGPERLISEVAFLLGL